MEAPFPSPALQLLLTSYRLKRWLQLEDEPAPPLPEGCEDVDVSQVQQLVELGLLDGLLPHLTEVLSSPTPAPAALSSARLRDTKSSGRSKRRDREPRRELSLTEHELIITIQVQDDAHRRCQEFRCAKPTLLQHMPYFRDVVRGQRLENVDITIHCELAVFGWLMRWVESRAADAQPPPLTADIVISVLSSADFLRMEPLVDACFEFISGDVGAVTDRPGVTCLNDRLLARLATLFHHDAVEALSAHERLRSRLYCQLTAQLCSAQPRPDSGHHRTAALLFRCPDCGRLLLPEVSSRVPCVARNLSVCPDGSLAYRHRRDPDWQLGTHVARLRRELRSWRLVYWRLWAAVHFLWCGRCERPFAASQLAGCRFHPEPARYGALARSAATPLGHHPCCGQTAVQFDPLQLRSADGCVFRDHLVQPAPEEAIRAADGVHEDLLAHRSLAVEPAAAAAAGTAETGADAAPLRAQTELQLVPAGTSGDTGLLPPILRPEEGAGGGATRDPPQRSISLDSAEFSASDDEEEGAPPAEAAAGAARPRTAQSWRRRGGERPEPVPPPPPAVWTPAASTRHNQDAQRHRETTELRRLADQLAGRQGGAGWRGRRGLAAAGTFLTIERELRSAAESAANSDGRQRRGRRK